jgi:hypothetical protein
MAIAAGMAAACALSGMTIGAGFAAVVLASFLDGAADIDNAQTRFTGTFHLSHSGHDSLLKG